MAQFDVFRTDNGDIVVDCQSDFWSRYNTRLAAPLMLLDPKLPRVDRLNPIFEIEDEQRVMMTEFAAAIPVRNLRMKIVSLADEELTIKSALDMLIIGF